MTADVVGDRLAQDEAWLARQLKCAETAIDIYNQKNAPLLSSPSNSIRKEAEKANYVPGQTVGWPVTGLRPGTRHMFRVSGKNYLGYPDFSPETVIFATARE